MSLRLTRRLPPQHAGAQPEQQDRVFSRFATSASSGFGVGVALSGTALEFTANSAGSAQASDRSMRSTAATPESIVEGTPPPAPVDAPTK